MSALLTREDRELMRENFSQVVAVRLSDLGVTLDELSERTGLSEEKLTGQEELHYKELVAVVDVLWPGKKPSEVAELWPWGVGAARNLHSLVALHEAGLIAPVDS